MVIEEWLRQLGLEQYARPFRENDIDGGLLASLTADDLKELGVTSIGHRRKLLDAIAALRKGESLLERAAAASATDRGAPADPGMPSPVDAERRQVTLMFCDLVGSTALSASMDAEDLRDIVAAYQTCAATTIHRFDGFVAKYMGDGILVYFGYPRAHEDDAERAVRAGLALVEAVNALKLRVALQTRIGIETGVVVVGDLIGSGEAQERGIVGETPNLAARLQGIAEPNTVVIGESTRKLLGNLFELQELGPQDLKGISRQVPAFVALRPASVESRFDAMHAAELTSFVGREEESQMLVRRWQRARARDGQVVLLSGEPGIGKSRLTAALLERIAGEPHTRLRFFCSPQHVDSPLYPIIGQLERAAGFQQGDDARSKLDRLDALLARSAASAVDCALLAELLSLPSTERYPELDLSPQQRRQRTLEALARHFQALARQPMLMIFEDVHWIDPTSLEALGHTVDNARGIPVLLIITFRPEFNPPWTGQSHVTALTLNRLHHGEASAIVERIAGDRPLSHALIAEIIERTDGIPLFVEEMTKAILESGETRAEHIASAVPSPSIGVPASLHASLMARLDRLGAAKEIAQIGAIIGRQFSYELLAAVTGRPEHELAAALDRLIDTGLIFRQGTLPYATFLFKHALVQDAAYGTLLRGPRQGLHARVARVLEQQFPERASAEPELLARHLTEAGQAEAAIPYWLKAGCRAAERSADEEAEHHLRRGLELLMTLQDSMERDRQELDFQLALGAPLVARHGWPDPLVGAARDRAIILCERLGDTDALLPSLFGQFAYCVSSGKIPMALGYAERCQALAGQSADRPMRLIANLAMGTALLELGELEAARVQLDQFLLPDNGKKDRALSTQYITDPHATGLGLLALTMWALGYPDKAVMAREEAFRHAVDADHANTSGFVSIYAGAQLSVLLGDADNVKNYITNLNERSEGQMPHWAFISQLLMGSTIGCAGQPEDGIALMKKGMDGAMTLHGELGTAGIHWPHYMSLFAVLQARAGNKPASLSAIGEAKEIIAGTGEYFWHSDVLRIEGELGLLFGASTKVAEKCFVQALEIARKQEARSFELRAATSLARLWRDQGRLAEGRELVTKVCDWFTEGFGTSDWRQAQGVLRQLG